MNERKRDGDLFSDMKHPAYIRVRAELLDQVGLGMVHPPGDYDYDMANRLHEVMNEALLSVGDQLLEETKSQSPIFPDRVLERVAESGGMRQVVLEYSQKKLEQLTSAWTFDSFDEQPGLGNTKYEKVMARLNGV